MCALSHADSCCFCAAPRRPSQGQLAGAAPVPSAPRQLAARPVSGEHRYSQPLESRPAARPGVGLEGGQQGAGPTAEERYICMHHMSAIALLHLPRALLKISDNAAKHAFMFSARKADQQLAISRIRISTA